MNTELHYKFRSAIFFPILYFGLRLIEVEVLYVGRSLGNSEEIRIAVLRACCCCSRFPVFFFPASESHIFHLSRATWRFRQLMITVYSISTTFHPKQRKIQRILLEQVINIVCQDGCENFPSNRLKEREIRAGILTTCRRRNLSIWVIFDRDRWEMNVR